MKTLRFFVAIIALLFLVSGYSASQYAALEGTAPTYAEKIDCPPVQWFALVLLLVCVVFSFIRDKEADGK